MINFFYNIAFIPIAKIMLFILKKFNSKVADREETLPILNKEIRKIPKLKNRIWFHSSSMGEFEQAKPLIELINKSNQFEIVSSFFSPSGYNNQKNYPFADIITYMPFDTKSNVIEFIELIKPDLAIFVRYDIWLNYLTELKNRRIDTILINATMPSHFLKNFPIFKQYYKYCFNAFHTIFTVDEMQSNYFMSLESNTFINTTSDTRLDRIAQQVELAKDNPIIPKELFNDDFVIVAGSTWLTDEKYLIEAVNQLKNMGLNMRVLYVPHEPTDLRIAEIKALVPNSIVLSELMQLLEKYNNNEVANIIFNKDVIVDSIGKLLRLYSIADVALIGCGWGDGVHSVSEPAGYGIPLICGPNINKMPDAVKLHQLGGLYLAHNSNDIYNWLKLMIVNKSKSIEIGKINSHYINTSKGASKYIADYILKFFS